MSNRRWFAVCPVCDEFTEKKSEPQAEDSVETHNDIQHNGEKVMIVVTDLNESLRELVIHTQDVATEEQLGQLLERLSGGDVPIFVSAMDYSEITGGLDLY